MTGPRLSATRPKAFVLTGSFLVFCRAPGYFQELTRRDLKILLVTPASWRDQTLSSMRDPAHPASVVEEAAFVEGSVDREGAFIAGVISRLRSWRERYTIVGVYAVGETMVEPTGLAADALGTPAPGLRASRACRSKYLQRWYLPEFSPSAAFVTPDHRDSFDVSQVAFPAVVKPAGRHSSTGVVTVYNAPELRKQMATYQDGETILVEDKVVGPEFSVESLVQYGEVIFASVTQKETTESSGRSFVELSHTVPSGRTDLQDTILAANQRMLVRLAFGDGITHSEWRVDPAGRPILMEVAARSPGDGLPVLYFLATGAPMEPQIIRIALGERAFYPRPRRHARQVYVEHESGVLRDVTVDWPGVVPEWIGEAGIWPEVRPGRDGDPPTLRAVFVLKDRGEVLGPLRSSEDRAVTFFIDAPSAEELDELDRRVRRAVTVHTAGSQPHRDTGRRDADHV